MRQHFPSRPASETLPASASQETFQFLIRLSSTMDCVTVARVVLYRHGLPYQIGPNSFQPAGLVEDLKEAALPGIVHREDVQALIGLHAVVDDTRGAGFNPPRGGSPVAQLSAPHHETPHQKTYKQRRDGDQRARRPERLGRGNSLPPGICPPLQRQMPSRSEGSAFAAIMEAEQRRPQPARAWRGNLSILRS